MTRYFTLDEARELLPEARRRVAEVAGMVAELQRRAADAVPGEIAEAKALEARIDQALGWFRQEGIQVKGVAPALLDFPARTPDGDVLLCWLQGEDGLDWYHPIDTGFIGRAPIAELQLGG